MIKNISTSEIKKFIEENSNVELLDVRTPQEWKNVGKPDGDKLGIKNSLHNHREKFQMEI